MASYFINKRLLRRLFWLFFFMVFIGTFALVHYDPICRKYISDYMSAHVSQLFKTSVSVEFDSFNPCTATLRCKNIHAEMHDWACDIENITFRGSWISLVTQGHFNIECFIEGGRGCCQIQERSCSIIKIIKDFIDEPSERPFIVTSLHFKKSDVAIQEKKWGIETRVGLSVSMKMQDSQYYIQHVLHRLQVFLHTTEICSLSHGSGDVLLKNKEPQGSLYYTLHSPLIREGSCIVYGVCSNTNTYLNIYSAQRTWDINLSYANDACTLKGSVGLSPMLHQLFPLIPMEADVAFDIQFRDGTIVGELLGNNLGINTLKVPPIKCTINHANGYGSGTFIFEENEAYLEGSFSTTPTEIVAHVSSRNAISLPWFSIEDKSLVCFAHSDYQDIHVAMESRIKHTNATEYVPFLLKMKGNLAELDAETHISDYDMRIKKDDDSWHLVGKKESQEFINGMYTDDNLALHGSQEVCKIVGDWINVPLAGTGKWQLNGQFHSNEIPFEGSFDGQLRVGDYYNLVEKISFKGLCNTINQQMYVDQCKADFRTGSFTINNASCCYGTENKYCTIPIQFHHLLITKQNEFFAQLDGCAYLYGPFDRLSFKGFCIADKSLITGNILSTELYKESSNAPIKKDIACDFMILTKNEIPIKTPLFKTDAQCFLQVTGSTVNPHLLGSIDFNNGSIYFPYDSLFIKKGTLQFNGMNLEPIIELVAKNSIKNYDITLGLHGTVLNPSITLTSSPMLTKEQLIALLLGGSEDGSLSLIMPHTMTELFEQLLFGSTATISKTQKYLHSLFEPLKSVRLVPKFSDQTGRGGLRGALEIEVTDRLKASIQQNFSLTEDTRVDISYALSDETNFKVTKDERGDVGGEIEMKWRW